MSLDNTRPDERQRLNQMFHTSGMSVPEIASALNTTQKEVKHALDRHGISRPTKNNRVPLRTNKRGYEKLHSTNAQTAVHQLVIISAGADPHNVYANDTVVHHKNRIRWDNRPENLEMMTRSEHTKHHWESGDMSPEKLREYTDKEMLDWIRMFVSEFGYVPTQADLDGWPGPTTKSYTNRFGTWQKAVNAAGWEIPNHLTDSKGRRVGHEDPKPVDGVDDE